MLKDSKVNFPILESGSPLTLWTAINCVAIICMIFIGGYTRLTDSGLSMTEWNPITGLLPPLNEADWQHVFGEYMRSPEYLKRNYLMDLREFKMIFWPEYIHRIAGRIFGLLYFLPLIYFILTRKIRGTELMLYVFAGGLLVLQGFAGWYMVKSGLISEPHVSHYRLAIHLFLAFSLYGILFGRLLHNLGDFVLLPIHTNLRLVTYLLYTAAFTLIIQIILGALVAGLDAGQVYNQFPLMGDSLIPEEVSLGNIGRRSFEDPVFVQFLHRVTACILTIITLLCCFHVAKLGVKKLTKAAALIMASLIFQIASGIITLIYCVPITSALLHQLGAVLLFSSLLKGIHLIRHA